MTSLTETAYYTRRGMKIGAIILVIFILFKISFSAFSAYWRKTHPAPPEKPNVAFGKLPRINFPSTETIKITNFQLETSTGELPTFNSSARVYFIPGFGPQFLALEKAQKLAEKLNLNPTPEKIREDIYRFSSGALKYELTINALSGNFRYFYPYLEDQTLINPQKLPTKEEAWEIIKNFLSETSRSNPDLENGKIQISYLKIQNQGLIQASSASDADLIRIDLFRQDVENKYLIVNRNLIQAPIYFLICDSDSPNKQIVEAVFNYNLVDWEKSATYPIKTASQAWEELKQGNYYLASLENKNAQQITIRQISLGYFEPTSISQFLQPIFIFQGDSGFAASGFSAYIPAVASEWLTE